MTRIIARAAILLAILAVGLSGCGDDGGSASRVLELAGLEQGVEFTQAPALAKEEASGALPPLAERLPDSPLVVSPTDVPGDWGGRWRMAAVGERDTATFIRTVRHEKLVRWDPEGEVVQPNLAERIEVSDDAREYRFDLRPGLRWSDGVPFTTADIEFAFNDVVLNEEVQPNGPHPALLAGGEVPELEIVDEHEFVLRFAEPNGLFLRALAGPTDILLAQFPRHYLEQFHLTYSPDVAERAAREGFDSWVDYFVNRGWPFEMLNPELPVMFPWKQAPGTVYTPGSTEVLLERNPYYWKVDPSGRQLPYIDEVRVQVVPEADDAARLATRGRLDMQDRHLDSADHQRALDAAAARGDVGRYTTLPSGDNRVAISLNLTHRDAAVRGVFADKRFRIALSHAIDRERIIDEVFDGEGAIAQVAPGPDYSFHDPELMTQFTEHDPDRARQILDEAGYALRDGVRRRADGAPIEIVAETTSDFAPEWRDVLDRVAEDWRAIGIPTRVRAIPRDTFSRRRDANLFTAAIWGGEGGASIYENPRYYVPVHRESLYGLGWARWFLDPEDPAAVEPPAEIQRQMDLYDAMRATPDPTRREELLTEMLDIAREQFYVIGVSTQVEAAGVLSRGMRNVPERIRRGWAYPSPAPTNPEQYFLEPVNEA